MKPLNLPYPNAERSILQGIRELKTETTTTVEQTRFLEQVVERAKGLKDTSHVDAPARYETIQDTELIMRDPNTGNTLYNDPWHLQLAQAAQKPTYRACHIALSATARQTADPFGQHDTAAKLIFHSAAHLLLDRLASQHQETDEYLVTLTTSLLRTGLHKNFDQTAWHTLVELAIAKATTKASEQNNPTAEYLSLGRDQHGKAFYTTKRLETLRQANVLHRHARSEHIHIAPDLADLITQPNRNLDEWTKQAVRATDFDTINPGFVHHYTSDHEITGPELNLIKTFSQDIISRYPPTQHPHKLDKSRSDNIADIPGNPIRPEHRSIHQNKVADTLRNAISHMHIYDTHRHPWEEEEHLNPTQYRNQTKRLAAEVIQTAIIQIDLPEIIRDRNAIILAALGKINHIAREQAIAYTNMQPTPETRNTAATSIREAAAAIDAAPAKVIEPQVKEIISAYDRTRTEALEA